MQNIYRRPSLRICSGVKSLAGLTQLCESELQIRLISATWPILFISYGTTSFILFHIVVFTVCPGWFLTPRTDPLLYYISTEIMIGDSFSQYLPDNFFFGFSAEAIEVCAYLQFGNCFFSCFRIMSLIFLWCVKPLFGIGFSLDGVFLFHNRIFFPLNNCFYRVFADFLAIPFYSYGCSSCDVLDYDTGWGRCK